MNKDIITSGELIYYAHELSKDFDELLIIPISDIHYGNPLFSKKHLMRTLKFLEKPNAYGFLNGDLCLSPKTRVLKGNLTYAELGNVKVGDELIGVTEDSLPRGRGVVHTNVISGRNRYADTFKVRLEDETEFIVTPEHLWLVRDNHKQPRDRWYWARTDKLSIGDSLLKVFPVWDTPNDWETGYIAGLLDGEGSICLREGSEWRARQLAFSQQEGLVMSYFEDYLRKHNISYQKNKTTPQGRMRDTFGILIRTDAPKLLGMTQPQRLAGKAYKFVEKKLNKATGIKIVDIQPYKRTEVRTIQTDCHTFIAEGVATHNCESTLRTSKGEIFEQVGSPEKQ
ncbi:unnamed protein product, partial [marine sediment metagenome]